jgi:hypothetical protein
MALELDRLTGPGRHLTWPSVYFLSYDRHDLIFSFLSMTEEPEKEKFPQIQTDHDLISNLTQILVGNQLSASGHE